MSNAHLLVCKEKTMIMTLLEARVASEQWEALQQAFEAQAKQRPGQLLQSFLVQSTTDPTVWQIIGLWLSREALEEMRRSTSFPQGESVFDGCCSV